MDYMKLVRTNLTSALDRLADQVEYYGKFEKQPEKMVAPEIDLQEFERTVRDSLIQRFKFCVDMFWKYLKKYMDVVVKTPAEINGPVPVIRAACKAKLITEADAELFLEMVKSRNLTSHIYKEEVAEQMSAAIPRYYRAMRKSVESLKID